MVLELKLRKIGNSIGVVLPEKALAHSRPVGRADTLTLVSEATRLLGALGERTVI